MIYIIIAIAVIILLLKSIKYVLFHPKINSIFCVLYMLSNYNPVLRIWSFSSFRSDNTIPLLIILRLLFIFSVIDCIRDIVAADDYTEFDHGPDVIYVWKSLTSLVTFGLSRALFRLLLIPLTAFSVYRYFRAKIKAGKRIYLEDYTHSIVVLRNGSRYLERLRSFCFQKELSALEKRGIIISNSLIVEKEIEQAKEKLENLYPVKLQEKIVDAISGYNKMKGMREKAEKVLLFSSWDVAYIPSEIVKKIPELVIEALSDKGMCPLSEIKYYEPLQRLNILAYTRDNSRAEKENRWFDFFIIQALIPLVSEGIFEDNDFNDNDPLDNHAYRYSKSTKPMKSQGPETNPLLALDDDNSVKKDNVVFRQRKKRNIFGSLL